METRIKKIFSYLLALALLIIWLCTGFFTTESGQYALVLRFGALNREVSNSGIHYRFPQPIEQHIKYRVNQVQTTSIPFFTDQEYERITGDANLILVSAAITFEVKNLKQYLFNSENVYQLIRSASQRSLSNKIAQMKVDDIMTTGKSEMRQVLKYEIQKSLDSLNCGVWIKSVELTDISPPKAVAKAFNDVSDARVKKQEIIKSAEGYANSVVPNARGKASSIIADAEAYALERQNHAEGAANAFNKLYEQYQINPSITMKQRYITSISKILNTANLTIDGNPNSSIYYFGGKPFDTE